jgi:molybdopterin-guanine dinucleotide biosynthesis protein MobB
MTSVCIIGVGGYSGSGKTTLIEKALPELTRRGLSVGVLKHSHHTLTIDREGKDTDRFFRAGAVFVSAEDPSQGFARYASPGVDLADTLSRFPKGLDLIIVEGYKGSEIPGRILLARDLSDEAGSELRQDSRIIYRDDPEYLQQFLHLIEEELRRQHEARPLAAGLLVGGRSGRMGRPKGLLELRGRTLMEQTYETLSLVAQRVLLLGGGDLPACLNKADRLPDAFGVQGPLAGMLSAFRWAPGNTWLISSVDMPFMHQEAWNWLLSQRRPGAWAVMPRRADTEMVEATGACYEPEFFDFVESRGAKGILRLQSLACHPRVLKPVIPPEFEQAWQNVNTPAEWEEAVKVMAARDI